MEPAFVGWPGTTHPQDDPANYFQAVKAKAQNAAVIYVHPGLPSEYPVDIALGVVGHHRRHVPGRRRKEHGALVPTPERRIPAAPISAGTDSYFDLPYHLIPGAGGST